MSWESVYHSKICTADTAVEVIKSHDRVFMTGNCSVPKELLAALCRRAPEVEDVEIARLGLDGALAADPALRRGLNIHDGAVVHPGLQESLGVAA